MFYSGSHDIMFGIDTCSLTFLDEPLKDNLQHRQGKNYICMFVCQILGRQWITNTEIFLGGLNILL